mgnify:CR=1 FL=1
MFYWESCGRGTRGTARIGIGVTICLVVFHVSWEFGGRADSGFSNNDGSLGVWFSDILAWLRCFFLFSTIRIASISAKLVITLPLMLYLSPWPLPNGSIFSDLSSSVRRMHGCLRGMVGSKGWSPESCHDRSIMSGEREHNEAISSLSTSSKIFFLGEYVVVGESLLWRWQL